MFTQDHTFMVHGEKAREKEYPSRTYLINLDYPVSGSTLPLANRDWESIPNQHKQKHILMLIDNAKELEIDRYIVLPIFFPILKHFTIIGYWFCNIGFTNKCHYVYHVVVLRIARRIAIAAHLRGDKTTTTVACTGTWFAVVSQLYLT